MRSHLINNIVQASGFCLIHGKRNVLLVHEFMYTLLVDSIRGQQLGFDNLRPGNITVYYV